MIPRPATPPLAIVGAGRLGSTLAAALGAADQPPLAVAAARPESEPAARTLAERLGLRWLRADEAIAAADLVVLATPDRALEAVAAALPWRAGQGVAHCAGAAGLDVLAAAASAGALPGCFHPLQSFPVRDDTPEAALARFQGIVCGVEGAEPLGGWLASLAAALGAATVRLEGVDRALYHAAAVLGSNDVVALMAAATRAWVAAGLPREQARPALAPLLRGVAENLAAADPAEALTGPLARGDLETIVRHLAALDAADRDLGTLYRALGAELLRLPLALDEVTRARLDGLLQPKGGV